MNNRNLAYDVEREPPTERVTLDAETLRFCAQLLEKRAKGCSTSDRSPIAKALREAAREIWKVFASPVVK